MGKGRRIALILAGMHFLSVKVYFFCRRGDIDTVEFGRRLRGRRRRDFLMFIDKVHQSRAQTLTRFCQLLQAVKNFKHHFYAELVCDLYIFLLPFCFPQIIRNDSLANLPVQTGIKQRDSKVDI